MRAGVANVPDRHDHVLGQLLLNLQVPLIEHSRTTVRSFHEVAERYGRVRISVIKLTGIEIDASRVRRQAIIDAESGIESIRSKVHVGRVAGPGVTTEIAVLQGRIQSCKATTQYGLTAEVRRREGKA